MTTNTDQRRQPWYLLHCSTAFVASVVVLGLLGPNFSGYCFLSKIAARPDEITDRRWSSTKGWPLTYEAVDVIDQLRQSARAAMSGMPKAPIKPPKVYFSRTRLAVDVAVAICLVLGAVYSVEVFLRRTAWRPRVTLKGLMVCTGTCAAAFAVYRSAPNGSLPHEWNAGIVYFVTRKLDVLSIVAVPLTFYALLDLVGLCLNAALSGGQRLRQAPTAPDQAASRL